MADVINCVTGAVGIASAAVVITVLNPVLLGLLVVAELPGGWAAVRSARIGYTTNFALADSRRRKWMLADLMAERETAAELRSFTLRTFLLARGARLAAYERDAQLRAAWQQAASQGLYFSDYLAFCADCAARARPGGTSPAPRGSAASPSRAGTPT